MLRLSEISAAPDRLMRVLDDMKQHHARPKETEHGMLYVTNLSNFPSSLNVILVQDGVVDDHREDFMVNLNLKRCGCTGRAALTLAPPNDAQQDKFRHLYLIPDVIPTSFAAIELVRLVQCALCIYGYFPSKHIDGLLCDLTETSLFKWREEMRHLFVSTESNDGILGPSSVALLLGLLLGARYRLKMCGITAPKDPCSIGHWKSAIQVFLKQQKLPPTNGLDASTLQKLHNLTSKNRQRLLGSKTLRSQVTPLSRSSRAHGAEVETEDMEAFAAHVSGHRLKHLWQGKGGQPIDIPLALASSSNLLSPTQSSTDLKELARRRTGRRPDQQIRYGVGKIKGVAGNFSQKIASRSRRDLPDGLRDSAPLKLIQSASTTHSSLLPSEVYETDYEQDDDFAERQSLSDVISSSSEEEIDEVKARPRQLSTGSNVPRQHHLAWFPRRMSFSLAANAVLPWDQLPSNEWMSKDRKLEDIQKLNSAQLQELKSLTADLLAEPAYLPNQLSSFTKLVRDLQDRVYESNKLEEDVSADIKNAALSAAKLQYEEELLEDRLEDIEVSVDEFASTLAQLQSRMERLMQAGDEHPAWNRLSWLEKYIRK